MRCVTRLLVLLLLCYGRLIVALRFRLDLEPMLLRLLLRLLFWLIILGLFVLLCRVRRLGLVLLWGDGGSGSGSRTIVFVVPIVDGRILTVLAVILFAGC